MGRISDEDVQRVRDATDVVSLISERIVLKPKGRLFWGLCPFHGEKTPSFKVDPATQLWHCFGCGKGGDVFGFIMESDTVEFPDAVRLLADRSRIDIAEETGGVPRGRKERLLAALEETAEFYSRALTGSRESGPAGAREYLARRKFGSEVAKKWTLGYASGRGALVRHLTEQGFTSEELVEANLALQGAGGTLKDRFYERIMFPIRDLQGRTIAFGGRVVASGEPKYLNTNDTPVFKKSANMYAIDTAKGPITASGTAVVVEGYTDVIALHEAGMTNVVATLGTALTRQHVRLLGRFARRIVYLFDGDEAGMRAADRATEFVDSDVTPEAGGSRVELSVAVIPDGLDPADFVAAKGAEAMRTVVAEAVPLLRFAIDRRLARWDLDRPEERARALKEAAEVLAPIKNSLLADDYANYIADRLLADFTTVRTAIARSRPTPQPQPDAGETPSGGADSVPLTPRLRAELELLALLVTVPEQRVRARELLQMGLLSAPEHRAVAEAIRDAMPGLPPNEMLVVIGQCVPDAPRLLSSARMDGDVGDADVLADGLERRLKEFELERRIAVGKAMLRQPAATADAREYDRVFREVSTLQRTLDRLRRGEDVSSTELEAQE